MNKRKIIQKWISENGCADFDLRKKDIILHDGGLFYIDKKPWMRSKKIWFEPIKDRCKCGHTKKEHQYNYLKGYDPKWKIRDCVECNCKEFVECGCSKVCFSKQKVKDYQYRAVIWMKELDETIAYLNKMKKMLNTLGYKTRHERRRKK